MDTQTLENYSFTISSKYRKDALISLDHKPKTPKDIADETKSNLTHVSRALRELTEKKLVECLTPSKSKFRLYQLTTCGHDVLSQLQK